jgi:tripartite-type tricarboxylate transporter receptor subunit TctC
VLFRSEAGIDLVHVPFRSTPDALLSLMRNDSHLLIDSHAALKSGLEGKQIRALATSGPRRSAVLPNVPTVREAGVAGFEVTSWNALFAPKGTPQPVIDALNKAIVAAVNAPDVKAKLLNLGLEPMSLTPAEFGKMIADDTAKWTKVVKAANMKVQ